jgi:hypothetical protein
MPESGIGWIMSAIGVPAPGTGQHLPADFGWAGVDHQGLDGQLAEQRRGDEGQ